MFKNISMVAVILSISYACLYAGTGAVTPTNEELMQKAHRMQMPFIANEGQTDEQVAYYAKTFGGTVCVTKEGGIVYLLPKYEADAKGRHTNSSRAEGQDHVPSYSTGVMTSPLSQPQGTSQLHDKWWQKIAQGGPDNIFGVQPDNHKQELSGVTLKEEFVGGKTFDIRGEKRSETKVSYFRGNDPSKWKTNIATYEYATLGEVYKGIEIRLKAYGNNVEKLFCVKPGANPEQINIRLSGAETSLEKEVAGLSVNEQGELVTETALGPVKFTKPVAYQEINGKRVEVEVGYMVTDSASTRPGIKNQGMEYGFTVASYDRTKDLIIDPLLASTFLGGSNGDWGFGIALDSNGNVFVTGRTTSSDLPTTVGAYDRTFNGYYDVYVSKFNNNLTSLLASTFLGGSDWDEGRGIALDKNGNVFVTGFTYSINMPTTAGAYDVAFDGGSYIDVFVSKFSNDLTNLLASTFLEGNGKTYCYGIALDSSNNVFVAGYTKSTNLPTTVGAYDRTYNGDEDVFVSKFSNDLKNLLASTYLGGNNASEECYGIALDKSGNVFVTGWTGSPDFPTTAGAYDTILNARYIRNVFVSKFSNDLKNLLASTFLEGTKNDEAHGIALDSSGNVFVSVNTNSPNLPTTVGVYDSTYNGGDFDIMVSKFSNDLKSLLASTYLGGNVDEECYGLALDKSDNVFITGYTNSSNYPSTAGAYNEIFNGYYDTIVSKFSNDLKNLLESTFLGGNLFDEGKGITLDSNDNVFITGYTNSTNHPVTAGAYDGTYNGGSCDAFIAKFNNLTKTSPTPSPEPSPTPTPCTATKLTVTLTCGDGSPSINQPVTIKLYIANEPVTVSPAQVLTDGNGQATFTITAAN